MKAIDWRWVEGGIGSAALRDEPWPHKIVPAFFPADVYAKLMQNRPRGPMPLMYQIRGGNKYEDRWACDLAKPEQFPSNRVFWRWFGAELLSQAAMISIAAGAGLDLPARPKAEALYLRDGGAFAIGPHTDAPRKLLTALIYLPAGMQSGELGTMLYQTRDAEFADESGRHFDSGDPQFEAVKIAEYLPNRALVFARTDRSFHGRPAMAADALRGKRDLIAYAIYG